MYQTVRHLLDQRVDPRRVWWLRLDHPLLLSFRLGDLVRQMIDVSGSQPGDELFLFLDELVYAKDWELWLKTFYDDRWPVRVIGTSSATAASARARIESGVGRWSEQYLPPYLFSEFLDLVGSAPEVPQGRTLGDRLGALSADVFPNLDGLRRQFLLVGGFPELLVANREADSGDDEDRLLRSQQVLRSDAVERAVYKDIPQSFGLDNPMALERLLYTLGGQIGGLISPTKLGGALGFAQPTFDRYLSYLERAFLVFTLPNYSGNEASVQRRGRKLYFVDGAVRNAALQRGVAPLNNFVELGMLTENLVAANLHALATRAGVRLYFWREGSAEVDFVFDHPTEPAAFEVGLSPDHPRKGLHSFVERHPRFRGRCWLVSPGALVRTPSQTADGIGTIPLDVFLVVVGRQAEQALQEQLGV